MRLPSLWYSRSTGGSSQNSNPRDAYSTTRCLTAKSPVPRHVAFVTGPTRRNSVRKQRKSKKYWTVLSLTLILVFGILAVGIEEGLKANSDPPISSNQTASEDSTFRCPPLNTTGANGSYWKPTTGTKWQIVLKQPLTNFDANVAVYDIDLFENQKETVDHLHDLGRKVICYFSAGSYEDFRPDSDKFQQNDYGRELVGWPGEKWVNTDSPSIRSIMKSRIQQAAQLGCDGIDPDDIDGYTADTGFPLSTTTATSYLNYLIDEAHALNLSIGLKNAAELVESMKDKMQWSVNEHCVTFHECDKFRGFVGMGKPVFHVEYVQSKGDELGVQNEVRDKLCGVKEARGFSSLLKTQDLGDWVQEC
ncbi:hypothetical protein HYFRA_00003676 [Hymenoscyphus fraxineus]|uniref:alpha-galactosidase n=1 Tax=Hymenoscyphus fraxineus TaxID=746836 RepID=A0A9N9L0B2_9HELO|nr:hypothetical protein HYFRA_00003676 [Hymenoscyphus fraxineus]